MSDLDLVVTLSREFLGLAPLPINDTIRYRIGKQFLGGTLDYQRTSISSPYIDGEIDTHATKQMVSESCELEIYGRTQTAQPRNFSAAAMTDNLAQLVAAISQVRFTLAVTVDDQQHAYQCLRSGYQIVWDGPRLISRQGKVTIALRRYPNPVEGAW